MIYKNVIIKLFIFICIIVLLIVSLILLNDFLSLKENNEATEQLIETVVNVETNPDTEKEKTTINWEELKQINSDIIAWIKIENTNIDYPILKDKNLFYLTHSYNKDYNKNGSIFINDDNPFVNEETIIYGHNMKNRSMFSDLGNYLNKDFFNTHNVIKIYTPNGNYEGKIFSAYSISIDDENNNIKSLNFNEKIEYYKKTSKYTVNNVDNINKIIKLSTCSYINAKSTPTEQRYYIVASLFPIL